MDTISLLKNYLQANMVSNLYNMINNQIIVYIIFTIKILSKEQFDGIASEEHIIILNYGEHVISENSDDDHHTALFWTFTTKRFIRFLDKARQQSATRNSLNCSIDVTFGLTKEEYNFGLLVTVVPVKRNTDNYIVYQFVPFLGFFANQKQR